MRTPPPGVNIIEQGESAPDLYLISSGHADVGREESDGTLKKLHDKCPITPDLLPEVIWRDIFAHEYFVRIYPGIEMETDLCPPGR